VFFPCSEENDEDVEDKLEEEMKQMMTTNY
jgi:hypothetical protein